MQGCWYVFPPGNSQGHPWNAPEASSSAAARWARAPQNLRTPRLLCLPENKRDCSCPQRAGADVFWRGHRLAALPLSLCMEITHRCEAFDTSKLLSGREFCPLQAARAAGCRLPRRRRKHLKEPRSALLRSRRGVHYSSAEKRRLLCVAAGKLPSQSVHQCLGVLPSDILYNNAAESGDTAHTAQPGAGLPT